MRHQYVIYTATGRILRTGHCGPRSLAVQAQAEEMLLEVASLIGITPETHWVDAGELAAKGATQGVSVDTTEIAADGVDMATITGVAAGAMIYIDNVPQGTADGSAIEVTFDLAGAYQVRIAAHPCLDWEVTIHAL